MNLSVKKVAFLGDSITLGYGTSSHDKNYVSVFGRITNTTVYNYGISGTNRVIRE